jgi:hypothetical protein
MESAMKSVQHFELDQHTACRHYAHTDCCIRVISGRLWLTVEGESHDAWLAANAEYVIAKGHAAWLGAEPVACIAIIARHDPVRDKNWRFFSRWHGLSRRLGLLGMGRAASAEKWLTA